MPSLDIVRFVRRVRMHGFALHLNLNTSLRNNSARLAFSRPLKDLDQIRNIKPGVDPMDISTITEKYAYIESLDSRDVFAIGFFKRYGKLISSKFKELADEKDEKNVKKPSSFALLKIEKVK